MSDRIRSQLESDDKSGEVPDPSRYGRRSVDGHDDDLDETRKIVEKVDSTEDSAVKKLQKDDEAKDQQVIKPNQEVIQLGRRLDHAGRLEDRFTRLIMEASTPKEEKRKVQKHLQLQHGQSFHYGEADVQQQTQLTIINRHENKYREEIAQLKRKLVTAERKLHSGPVTHIDGAETQKLTEALQQEMEIRQLRKQQQSYQKTATEVCALQKHSTKRSKQVMQLQSHVDAAKIGETERTEYEQYLMEALHSFEDQYDKLMKDYQAVSKDKGYMEQSLTALKKRNEELVSKLQECEHQDECERLQQQLQRRANAAQQQSQLLQQRLDAALAEVQHLRHSSQIASKSHKPWNVSRQDIQILSEIGRGAWGTVCKGKFQGRQVAVKLPHPAILDEQTIDRLQREVKIMAEVRHPNLLHFIGAVFDNEASRQPVMIILELLDMNLRMAYQSKRLLESSRVPIFRDVAYALHYLHERQEPIIHRDVSAPNVLLEELPNGMWRAKVSDFGSANLARLAQTMGEGAIIYAAPETIPQARKLSSPPLPQTTKIDVYSYGILLCEVIMSQLPDPERFWIMLQQVQRQWPFMHKLILSCASDIADERPTMAEVLDQLNTLPRPQLSSQS